MYWSMPSASQHSAFKPDVELGLQSISCLGVRGDAMAKTASHSRPAEDDHSMLLNSSSARGIRKAVIINEREEEKDESRLEFCT